MRSESLRRSGRCSGEDSSGAASAEEAYCCCEGEGVGPGPQTGTRTRTRIRTRTRRRSRSTRRRGRRTRRRWSLSHSSQLSGGSDDKPSVLSNDVNRSPNKVGPDPFRAYEKPQLRFKPIKPRNSESEILPRSSHNPNQLVASEYLPNIEA